MKSAGDSQKQLQKVTPVLHTGVIFVTCLFLHKHHLLAMMKFWHIHLQLLLFLPMLCHLWVDAEAECKAEISHSAVEHSALQLQQ